MSTDLRRAIANYLRCTWWIWALAGVLQGVMALSVMAGGAGAQLTVLLWLGVIFFLNGYLQSVGWLRTLCTLPLSRKEVGRLRWWSMIGVPAAVLSAATLLAMLLAILIILGTSLAMLMTMLFILVTRPDAHITPTFSPWKALNDAVFNANSLWRVLSMLTHAWGTLGFFMLFLDAAARGFAEAGLLRRVGAAVVVVGIGVAWYSFVILPIDRMLDALLSGLGIATAATYFARASRFSLTRPIARRASTKEWRGQAYGNLTGWLAIMRQQAFHTTVMIAFFVMLILVSYIMQRLHLRNSPIELPVYTLALLGMTHAMVWMPSARMFRTLPLTAERLAFYLLVVVSWPMIVVIGAIYAVGIYSPSEAELSSLAFLLSLVTLGVPIALRFGHRPIGAMLIAMLIFLVGVVLALATVSPMSLLVGFKLGAGALSIAVSYAWTRYELVNGVHAYRPRPVPVAFGGIFQRQ